MGAQRAGTTWWYRGLEAHDRVVRPKGRRKELHYFNRFWQGEVPDDLVERYAELFPKPEGTITGEWTPRYMHDFWSLRLLARAAPDARILVLLRDPVERWRSGTARAVRLAEEAGEPIRLVQLSDAVWRGFYFEQLRRIFDLFPAGAASWSSSSSAAGTSLWPRSRRPVSSSESSRSPSCPRT